MATVPDKPDGNFQRSFHERWGFLNDPHVRALAWLLDAPDLLEPAAAQWKGKIAALEIEWEAASQWLKELDARPEALHAWLNLPSLRRLGRYAEKLLAFHFNHAGKLVAQGLQLRGHRNETIGEFDFLLGHQNGLLHLELATKFYLLAMHIDDSKRSGAMDYLIGPNLADTLGLKMQKIIDRQLMLGQHPAASTQLSRPVDNAKALIKGWLFYHEKQLPDTQSLGLSGFHCRGYWCTVSELAERTGCHYIVLPRLSWLPPAKTALDGMIEKPAVIEALNAHFRRDTMPVLLATLEEQDGYAVEVERGFIVPDDWQARAQERTAHP